MFIIALADRSYLRMRLQIPAGSQQKACLMIRIRCRIQPEAIFKSRRITLHGRGIKAGLEMLIIGRKYNELMSRMSILQSGCEWLPFPILGNYGAGLSRIQNQASIMQSLVIIFQFASLMARRKLCFRLQMLLEGKIHFQLWRIWLLGAFVSLSL